MKTLLAFLLLTLAAAAGAHAQAPAGAPAGANGICKDGTYSMQATKDGACRGHKGVQTWYLAAAAKPSTPAAAAAPATMPAPAPAATAPSRPTPAPAQAAPTAMPAPTPAPASTASTGTRKGPAAAASAKTAAAGGAPGLVWLNTSSNVYHCYGTTYYGKTKAGSYMSEADAKAKGAHNEGGKPCPAQ